MEKLFRPQHKDVRVNSGFWHDQLHKIHTVTVQDVLDKFQKDGDGVGLMKNFEWVIAGEQGKHVGPPWYDGLIYETLRGISDIIAHTYDKKLDETIELYSQTIAAAQDKDQDGYINTYGTLICPANRWGQHGGSLLWQHELYNLGCLIEAGIHYYLATGKTLLLNCGIKSANYMCKEIGPEPRKNIIPAHSLPEEAVVKLYRLLKDQTDLVLLLKEQHNTEANAQNYLDLSVFWMEHRGVHYNRASYPKYMGEYSQDHCPVCQQSEAVGHAVRAALMYTGLVATGIETDNNEYLSTAKKIWDNVVETKLHVSGGIGAVHQEERFGYQYDLPNNAYLETCAGVALAFWAGEMHRAFKDSSYIDVFERALYNNILPGLSYDGTHYFYENPLISDGSIERWKWHSCPCCPPMFLKIMGSLPDYIYSYDSDSIYINLHIGSSYNAIINDTQVTVSQTNCGIPWNGENTVTIDTASSVEFLLAIRIPEWSGDITFSINGEKIDYTMQNGYATFKRMWKNGDSVHVSMELPAVRIEAHPYVQANVGRIALQRGPLLYCIEAIDNDGTADIMLAEGNLAIEQSDMLGGSVLITGPKSGGGSFTAVPYYQWNNRGKGEMAVWLCQEGVRQVDRSALKQDAYAAHSVALDRGLPDLSGWERKLYRVKK